MDTFAIGEFGPAHAKQYDGNYVNLTTHPHGESSQDGETFTNVLFLSSPGKTYVFLSRRREPDNFLEGIGAAFFSDIATIEKV